MKTTLILVADDDMDDRFLLKSAFMETGGSETIEFVENGVEVLNYINSIDPLLEKERYPSLIILDLNMPKKNGKEVLEELKQHPIHKSIPVVIYTTTRNESEMKECYALGADNYIVKPVTFESLREVVSAIRSDLTVLS